MLNKSAILSILLIFIPLSLASEYLEWGATLTFIMAALAIVPLATLMGQATEEIAVVVGPNLGGLLNATFGNATELILALVALKEGLIGVVKATISGYVIGGTSLQRTGISISGRPYERFFYEFSCHRYFITDGGAIYFYWY